MVFCVSCFIAIAQTFSFGRFVWRTMICCITYHKANPIIIIIGQSDLNFSIYRYALAPQLSIKSRGSAFISFYSRDKSWTTWNDNKNEKWIPQSTPHEKGCINLFAKIAGPSSLIFENTCSHFAMYTQFPSTTNTTN